MLVVAIVVLSIEPRGRKEESLEGRRSINAPSPQHNIRVLVPDAQSTQLSKQADRKPILRKESVIDLDSVQKLRKQNPREIVRWWTVPPT